MEGVFPVLRTLVTRSHDGRRCQLTNRSPKLTTYYVLVVIIIITI